MSDSTRRSRSGLGRRGERGRTELDPNGAAEAGADDWEWEDIDWSDDADRTAPDALQAARPARGSSKVGLIPAARPAAEARAPAEADRADLIHRRRVAALAAAGVLIACALVIPLVVFGGGGSSAETTRAPFTTPTVPTTTQEQPSTTTTTTTQTTTGSGQQPLRLTLGKDESLRRGARGSDVVTLQKALAALGFASGQPDGVFGRVTEAAVIDFQRSNNLDPDGVVGSDTARLLNTALARKGVTK